MLYRAPVAHLKSGVLTHRHGHLIVAMRFYPRYTPKELIDEYQRALAPDEHLFAEFKATDWELKDHNRAFDLVRYEDRFHLSPDGMKELARVARLAETKDVYLLCQCTHDQKCHCDLLLLTAQAKFGAAISQIPFRYPKYEKRLAGS
jgi:uncharacterized protein YeaO (DUF488 family)